MNQLTPCQQSFISCIFTFAFSQQDRYCEWVRVEVTKVLFVFRMLVLKLHLLHLLLFTGKIQFYFQVCASPNEKYAGLRRPRDATLSSTYRPLLGCAAWHFILRDVGRRNAVPPTQVKFHYIQCQALYQPNKLYIANLSI